MKSYINLFRNYANFTGYLKRRSYWTAMLIHLLILLVPLVPGIFFLLGKSDMLLAALDLSDTDPAALRGGPPVPFAAPERMVAAGRTDPRGGVVHRVHLASAEGKLCGS